MRKIFCIAVMMLGWLPPVSARDSDEPFLDPADYDPAESLRRTGRLMNTLRQIPGEPEQLEKIQEELEDRLTRTLLTMERDMENNSSSSGSGSGSSSRPNQKPQNQGSQGQPRQNQNSSNAPSNNPNPTGDPREGPKPDGGQGQEGDRPGGLPQGNKSAAGDDSDKWGQLPPKVRSSLKTNLARDVPEDLEDDMKDFSKRVKELE